MRSSTRIRRGEDWVILLRERKVIEYYCFWLTDKMAKQYETFASPEKGGKKLHSEGGAKTWVPSEKADDSMIGGVSALKYALPSPQKTMMLILFSLFPANFFITKNKKQTKQKQNNSFLSGVPFCLPWKKQGNYKSKTSVASIEEHVTVATTTLRGHPSKSGECEEALIE